MDFLRIINKHYNIFLLDALGASVSALLLFFLIKPNEPFFGVANSTAINLSIPVLGLLVFSSMCFFLKPQNWKLFMKMVIFGNLSYCLFTATIIFLSYKELTILGLLYFLLEILVIFVIVGIETLVVRKG